MKFKSIAVLAILLLLTLGFGSTAQADTTVFIHNLTTGVTSETPEGFVWQDSPQTDGNLTVLTRHDGNDREIFVYDSSLRTYEQITDNDLEDRYPRISGKNIAWVRGEGQASEIYLASYEDGKWKKIKVSDNSYQDSFPQIKGNYLVWQGHVDGDREILLYDIGGTGGVPTRITYNDYGDISPQTDGKYVVWLGFSRSGGEIFLYDVLSRNTTQITNDDNVDSPPQIANGRVVWTSCEVTDSVEPGEIFLYHIATGLTEQLTNNTLDDSFPRINDENIIWVQADFDPDEPNSPSPSGSTPQGSSGSSGGCFIATAAFGSPMEKHVTVLRSFKDTYLLPHALGRIFVRMYNKYSPPLAHFIAKHEILKVAVRINLLPLVAVSYATLQFGPVITLSMLVVLLILPIFLVSFYRRRAAAVR